MIARRNRTEPGAVLQCLTSPDEWHLPFELTKAVLALVLTDNRATQRLLSAFGVLGRTARAAKR